MFSLEWRRRVKLVCTHRRCVLGFGRASLSLAAIWWSDCRVTRCVHVCCARERYLFRLLDSTVWNYVVIFLLFGGGVAKEILSSFLHTHSYAKPLAVISFDLIVSNTPQHSNYILINLSRMLFEEARSSHRCLSDYSWPSPLIIFTSKNASYGSIRGEWMSFWSDTTASWGHPKWARFWSVKVPKKMFFIYVLSSSLVHSCRSQQDLQFSRVCRFHVELNSKWKENHFCTCVLWPRLSRPSIPIVPTSLIES